MKIKDTIRERMPLAYIAPKPKFWKKTTILSVIAIMLLATIGVAVITEYYGEINTTMNVINCNGCDVIVYGTLNYDFGNICLDDTVWTKNKIENTCNEEADISFSTHIIEGNEDGIQTAYYILDGWKSITLDNKDSNWDPIADNYQATFEWNPCCPTFTWKCSGTFIPSTEYVLIYYADNPSRFVNWGGAPAYAFATFTTDTNGDFDIAGDENLDTCLPYSDDWNIGPDADYFATDGYVHAKGAKIWLIPSAIYNGENDELTAWTPDAILFETDLIAYFDCDNLPCDYLVDTYFSYETPFTDPCYTLAPYEEICLFIKHSFTIEDSYSASTYVYPCPN